MSTAEAIADTATDIALRALALLDEWIEAQPPCDRAALLATRHRAVAGICRSAGRLAILMETPAERPN